ncbi:MAG TPA: class I SAM-dependent methyltransferase [Acidimicrobiia bacterium]|nr:class I SAM-dependent methyltransferase [Acidimicrobiia bacterium]
MNRNLVKDFMARFEALAAGAAAIGTLAIADRSGLLGAMAGLGSVTAEELAGQGFDERYTVEVLAALAAAGVLTYEPESERFTLPAEHAACLTDPASPYSLAGWLDMLTGAMKQIDRVAQATVSGGGVPLAAYDERVVSGIDRLNSPGIRILLTRRWLTAMPDVVARLEAGARVADVGCGSGAAALAMAAAYPSSTVIGFDLDPRAIHRAENHRRQAGLTNVSFERVAIEDLPTELPFDLITSFDVIHDLPRPREALDRIREALAPGATFLMVEPAVEPDLEQNLHTRGALLLGFSVLYCLPQSLVEGGMGLGTAWGPRRAEELCRSVGFGRFTRLAIDNPYSSFYRVEA